MKKVILVAILGLTAVTANAEYCGSKSNVLTEMFQKSADNYALTLSKFEARFPECNGEAACLDQKYNQWKKFGPEYDKARNALPATERTMFEYRPENIGKFYDFVYSKSYSETQKLSQEANAKLQEKLEENKKIDECQAKEDAKQKIEDAKWAKQQAAWKAESARLSKLPGVRVGMTADQVLTQSSWGRPNSVNRTTTQYGTHEQWVYGGSNYLYFDNGKLTAIQN